MIKRQPPDRQGQPCFWHWLALEVSPGLGMSRLPAGQSSVGGPIIYDPFQRSMVGEMFCTCLGGVVGGGSGARWHCGTTTCTTTSPRTSSWTTAPGPRWWARGRHRPPCFCTLLRHLVAHAGVCWAEASYSGSPQGMFNST